MFLNISSRTTPTDNNTVERVKICLFWYEQLRIVTNLFCAGKIFRIFNNCQIILLACFTVTALRISEC